jgi:phenylacetate-CoA ligase
VVQSIQINIGGNRLPLRESIIAKAVLPVADRIRGTSALKKAKFLENSQWWETSQIKEYQLEKFRALISHAYLNVPYYNRVFKERGLQPSDIKELGDITKIPILTKQDVRQHQQELVATNIPASKLRTGRTGGSTGEPLQLYNDANTLSWAMGSMFRYSSWTGMNLGEGRIDLGGGSLGGFLSKGGMKQTLSTILRKLQRISFFPSFELDAEMALEIWKLSQKHKIRTLRGYPSGLYLLAKFAESANLDFEHLRSIQSTSELLYPEQRETIETHLTADVYDQYGSGEIMSIAAQCDRKEAYHVFQEHVIVEDPAMQGKEGDRVSAILTDLDNYAMPFIRYELGDILNFEGASCSCSRNLRKIAKIEGRTHDFLTTSEGRLVPGEYIPHLFQKVKGFDRYFVHQFSKSEIEVKIVKNENFNPGEIERLRKQMYDIMGVDMKIEFREVSEIEKSPTGKIFFIKSDVEPTFD